MAISIEDFKKIEIKIGEIISAEQLDGSEKLLKLSVNFGEENPRQVLSGIASYFGDTQNLVGKRCAFVTNLEPRPMMGLLSHAMILAASTDGTLALFEVPDTIPPGTLVH